jgi:hypothetical protein
LIDALRRFWRRWQLVPHVAELERTVTVLESELRFTQKQLGHFQARCSSYEQTDGEAQREIQRLIREVGSLERQLKEHSIAPVTYAEDGAAGYAGYSSPGAQALGGGQQKTFRDVLGQELQR